jgi:hypothetical protein
MRSVENVDGLFAVGAQQWTHSCASVPRYWSGGSVLVALAVVGRQRVAAAALSIRMNTNSTDYPNSPDLSCRKKSSPAIFQY